MIKLINIILVILLFICTTAVFPIQVVRAASVEASITGIQTTGNSAHIEFSVPMSDNDVLYKTDFENSNNNLSLYYQNTTGNQSYVSTDRGTSLQIRDTITRNTGNAYNPPSSYNSSSSLASKPITSLKQGSKIQIQYDARSLSGTKNEISVSLSDVRQKYGNTALDRSGNIIKFKNMTAIKVYTNPYGTGIYAAPTQIPVYTDTGVPNLPDGELVLLLSSPKTNWQWGAGWYNYSSSLQAFVLNSSNSSFWYTTIGASGMTSNGNYTYNSGDAVIYFGYGDASTGTRDIGYSPNWVTYSRDIDIPLATDRIDLENYGANLRVAQATNGLQQLDNFKIGYAEKAILYRDGQQVYSGYDSSFTDTNAKDISAPGIVHNLAYTVNKTNKTVDLQWNAASDQGTDYTYTIQGQLRDGTTGNSQDPKKVNIKSGISGYTIVNDNNDSTVLSTEPISTQNTTYNFTPKTSSPYIHIAAVDKNGNVGPTQTISLADNDKPIINLIPSTKEPTRYGVTVSVQATDDTTWITDMELPANQHINNGFSSFIADKNGIYTVTAIDFMGNSQTETITISNIDQEKPIITMTPDQVSWQPDDIKIGVEVTDNFSTEEISLKYIVTNSLTTPDESENWISERTNPFAITIPKEQKGEWYLHVKAKDKAGNNVFKTSGLYQIKDLPDPISVEEIQMTSPTSDSLKITLPTQSEVGYVVKVGDKTVTINPGNTTATINNMEAGNNYTVIVTPINVSGSGPQTVVNTMTRPDAVMISKIQPEIGTDGRVTASVYAVKGADAYQFKLFDDQGIIVEIRENSNIKQTYNLKPNHWYELQVTSINGAGSGLSTIRSFLTVPSLTGLAVTEIAEDSTSFQWDSVTGDTYYELQRDIEKPIHIDKFNLSVEEDTYDSSHKLQTFTDRNLKSGTMYQYKVAAINESGSSVQRNLTVQTLPTKPLVDAAQISTDKLLLHITPVTGADKYDIYQDGLFLYSTNETNLQIDQLNAGTIYHFQIAARNQSGSGAYQMLEVLTKPEKVKKPIIINYTTTGATLRFDLQPGVENWIALSDNHMYRSSSPTLHLTELEPGTTYTFTLYTENATGKSESRLIHVVTLPGKLQDAYIQKVTENSITITWKELKGALYYKIHSSLSTIQVTGTKIELPTPGPGVLEGYEITPVGISGASPHSETLIAMGSPRPSVTSVKNIVTVTNITYQDAQLVWTPFEGAHLYRVYNSKREIGITSNEHFVLSNLESSTRYNEIYIVAENIEGRRSEKYYVDLMTLPDDRFSVQVSNISTSKVQFDFVNVVGEVKRIIEIRKQNGWQEVYHGNEATIVIEQLSDDRMYQYRSWLENEQTGSSRVVYGTFRTHEKAVANVLAKAVPIFPPKDTDLVDKNDGIPIQSIPDQSFGTEMAIHFNDIDNSYAKESIIRLTEMGIVQGVNERQFAPQQGTTRAQFMAMITRLMISKDQIEFAQHTILTFEDIDSKDWYFSELKSAIYYGIAEGYSSTRFEPDEYITREQAAKMLRSALAHQNLQSLQSERRYYTDSDRVSQWAREKVNDLTDMNIIQGYQDHSFRPQAILTREECVLILDRIIEKNMIILSEQ